MLTLILFGTTAISGIGWLTRYISTKALLYYLEQKGYPLPTDQEIKECTQTVAKHTFKVNQ